MEGGALQRAVGLPHHDDVYTSREGRGVESPVQLLDLHKHLAGQLTHIVHGLQLEGDMGGKEEAGDSVVIFQPGKKQIIPLFSELFSFLTSKN